MQGRVPCAAVRPIEDLFDHPQVLAEELVTRAQHPIVGALRTMTMPIVFGETPGPATRAAPTLGQHTDEILKSHDFSDEEVHGLRARGVVA